MSEHRPLEMPHLRAWQRWYDTRIQGAGLVMHAIPCVSEGEDIGFLAIIVDHPTKGLIYYRLESGFLSYHSDIDDWGIQPSHSLGVMWLTTTGGTN